MDMCRIFPGLNGPIAKPNGKKREYAKAENCYNTVIALIPKRSAAYNHRGLTRHAQGDSEQGDDGDGDDQELQAKLKEREDSVTRLLGAVKENEAKIAELTEAVDSWKSRYESLSTGQGESYKSAAEKFLETEAPDAYKTMSGK